jgi:membrane protein
VSGHVTRVSRTDEHIRATTESRRDVDKPTELPARSWWAVLKRTVREFKDDNLTDWAAALTYYGLLALFPALLVLVAILGVFGSYPKTTNALLDIVRDLGPSSAVDTFRKPIEGVVRNKGGAGALLGVGLLVAIWSASGYVGAFMRASNAIYEVEEGRKFWKLRPLQIAVTIILVMGTAVVAIAVVATGPLADSIGDVIGLGSTAVTIWDIVKWPVLLLIVITMIAFLYYAAPNVKQPGFHWITPGSILAVVIWLIASVAFGFYAANFGSYNATYGSLGGVIIFLIWMWISNVAILLGAEFNAELERGRELAEGKPAEEELQLPPREAPKKT